MKPTDKNLQLRTFRSRRDAGWHRAWEIYRASFPVCEQRSEADYDRAFADPAFTAEGVWRGDELVGILFYWESADCAFLEHLAVDAALRGERLGSRILDGFCARHPRITLEIDPPEDEISIRRRGFYERMGFVMNPYDYLHPSYRQPFQTHRLRLMSRPRALTPAEATRFADFIRERVLRYSEHDVPTLPVL